MARIVASKVVSQLLLANLVFWFKPFVKFLARIMHDATPRAFARPAGALLPNLQEADAVASTQ